MAIRNNDYTLIQRLGGGGTPPFESICLQLEDGSGNYLQEDGDGCYLTENSNPPPPMDDALLLQDGSSYLLQQDGSSKILLQP